MENQQFHEGDALKLFLKKTGDRMDSYSKKLGMTKQNFYYHLKKSDLDEDFKRLVEDRLKIDLSTIFRSKTERISDVPMLDVYKKPSPLYKSVMATINDFLSGEIPSDADIREARELQDLLITHYKEVLKEKEGAAKDSPHP